MKLYLVSLLVFINSLLIFVPIGAQFIPPVTEAPPNGLVSGSIGFECYNFHPGTNQFNEGCCKYPQLFSSDILRKCKNTALRGTVNGTTALYEDSCFLRCVFTQSGINITTRFSSDFITKALPYTLESPKSIITWAGAATQITRMCHNEFNFLNNRMLFQRVYRKELNKINPKRPICSPKIAAFWDCLHKNFYKFCYNEMIPFSSICETNRLFTLGCEWWARINLNA